jgi:hypothetical protein
MYKQKYYYIILYGCETRSFTLRKECRLRVFENRILRKILDPKGIRMESERRLHIEEHHCLCNSPNIVRVIKSKISRWVGHVARKGEEVLSIFEWVN